MGFRRLCRGPIVHEFSHCDLERFRQLLNSLNGYVPLAPFNTADVRPVQSSQLGKFFLRNEASVANAPQVFSESLPDFTHTDTLFRWERLLDLALSVLERIP